MSEFYWCIEYLATFIEIFLCCYFCGTFVVKEKIEDVRNRIIVLTIMASVMIILLNKLELFSYMTTLIFILLCVLMQCILYRKRYLHLVTLVLVYAAILSAIDFLVLYFVTINMNSDIGYLTGEQSLIRIICIMLSKCILILLVITLNRVIVHNIEIPIRYILLTSVCSGFLLISNFVLVHTELNKSDKEISSFSMIFFVASLGIEMIIFCFVIKIAEGYEQKKLASLVELNNKMLEYQKHLLDFDKVKSAVTCSDKVMEKICTGVAFTSYGLDILDTVVEVSKVRANNKVFATNMDALIRISIQSKDENISNVAFQIEQELAANYLGAISVFGNDIIENAVKEVVRYASTKNIYVFAVVATRDLIDLAFGVSNDIKQEYKILCYSEISKAYVDLISDMGMVSKNNNYYNVPEYSVIRFKRYMVNIEQLRVIGEIEYYNFYKCEGIFSKLGDWVYDTKSVKDLINAQLSNIKDWVDLLPLVLSEKIKYKI